MPFDRVMSTAFLHIHTQIRTRKFSDVIVRSIYLCRCSFLYGLWSMAYCQFHPHRIHSHINQSANSELHLLLFKHSTLGTHSISRCSKGNMVFRNLVMFAERSKNVTATICWQITKNNFVAEQVLKWK